ncbi:hypothetical protein BP6252_10633 [Coleophoma cylindrospora]|uniref:Zn(2)-C6 fungal-type domain-containing protein n=1 Tax=Coleophoma cylindrospora TaxID=1849047 RepID=A0A3D8QT82_9HELO|nr:hypothetical protein BP6252_10633 [Coleophoma cylindrospora]
MDVEWSQERDEIYGTDAGTEAPEDNNRGKTRRTNRTRAACTRCQRRKIKCDGSMPCASCRKARVACVENARQQEYPKAYISNLKDRIKWLESILSDRCPEVDLSEGPRIVQENAVTAQIQPDQNVPQPANLDASSGIETVETIANINTTISAESQSQPLISEAAQPERVHEIGLISVTGGQDLRYVGPSSGFFFAKLVLACAGRQGQSRPTCAKDMNPISALSKELFQVSPASLPANLDQAIRLSSAYWEVIQSHYPFLHQPSHLKLMEHMYSTDNPRPIAAFQVNMVLAISTTILSRRLKVSLSAEGFCAAAMTYFDSIPIEGSLEGLQSLLLLQIYAMNNPSMGLNVWYLNYQCIAAVLDLGLQRDVRAGNNVSLLTQEMRTRIFWVVYSLDRTLATIMGRPIGLRDEACELRLPADKEDSQLCDASIRPRDTGTPPSPTTTAIHLIKLAKLNSEIKYVANSISHKTPAHTYPRIPNISEWQSDILERLKQWFSDIPQFQGPGKYMTKSCELKYHEVRMLLLRPSPAIPYPSQHSLQLCYHSAISIIHIFDELYRGDLLIYSWATVHSVFLATITMLYCIWVVPAVTKTTKLDVLIADLKSGSNVLSATAEHWTEAKRSRDVLDELSEATIRWIMETQARATGTLQQQSITRTQSIPQTSLARHASDDHYMGETGNTSHQPRDCSTPALPAMREYLNPDVFTSIFGQQEDFDPAEALDVNSIMQGVFSDYQIPVDFGHDFLFDGQI